MEGKLVVRAETAADFAAVRAVNEAAFGQPQEARPLGIEAPFPVPDHAWMIRAWRPVAPGRVRYPPAFDEV